MEKKFVKIQSNDTITVTCGLDYVDLTNRKLNKDDKLKVSPEWSKATCLIKQGQHIYPAVIAKWPTVINLQKDGILTIGSYCDETGDDSEVENVANELNLKLDEIKKKVKKQDKSLSNLIEEE